MESLNFVLELFKKSKIPFKVNTEGSVERELKIKQMLVLKEHVLKGHVQSYLNVINSLEKKKGKARSSLVLLFEGFEHDHRKMYEVPEIKTWIQKILHNKPNLFYFLVNVNKFYVHDVMLCMVNPVKSFIPKELQKYTSSSSNSLSGADTTPIIRKYTEAAFNYSKKQKDSPEELMEFCMTLLDNMSYDHYSKNKFNI